MHVSFPIHRGFTLIELMIVVAILGSLAAVAIPAFAQYVRESKTVEANEKMRALADGAITYFNSEHHYSNSGLYKTAHLYPGCQAGQTDPVACTLADTKTCDDNFVGQIGKKEVVADSVWASEPWQRLGFQIGGPTYYCYYYGSTVDLMTSTFEAKAEASLSGANDSEYTISGDSDGHLMPLLKVK